MLQYCRRLVGCGKVLYVPWIKPTFLRYLDHAAFLHISLSVTTPVFALHKRYLKLKSKNKPASKRAY
jgi:hypothetical protein